MCGAYYTPLSKMKSKLGEQLFHKKFDLNNSLLSRINDIGKPRWYFPPSDEFNEWNPSQITGKIIKKKKEKIAGRNCNCTVVTINNISTTYWVDIDTNLILKWERNQLDSGPHSLRICKETLDFLLQKQTDSLFFIPSGFTAIIPQVIESEVPTPIGVKRILIPIPTEQELRKGNNVRVNR